MQQQKRYGEEWSKLLLSTLIFSLLIGCSSKDENHIFINPISIITGGIENANYNSKRKKEKLGVKNRIQAVSKANLLGLILVGDDREIVCDILLENL